MSSYFYSASQSCPILSANCRHNLRLFRIFLGDSSGIDKSSSAKCLLYIDVAWGAKSHVAKKISGRGLRRSRDEKGNRRVKDFRFTIILQLFSIYVFSITLLYHFFSILFFLPTTIYPHPHPHPRPTTSTHYPQDTTHDI